MDAFPSLTIEGVTISRAICGTNALLGWSHVSAGRDAWLRATFDPPRIARVFARCQELGVNAVMGPLDPRLIDALDETARLTGVRPIWVATTSMDRYPADREEAYLAARRAGRLDEAMAINRASIGEQAAALQAAGAAFCLVHGACADHWPLAEGRLVGLAETMAEIRAAGLVPGSATHFAERVTALDNALASAPGGPAVLATPVNKGGWMMIPSRDEALARYGRLHCPLIAIKTLACGRYDNEYTIEEWLRWAVAAPGVAAIALGVMVEQEAEQSLPVLRDAFAERYGA